MITTTSLSLVRCELAHFEAMFKGDTALGRALKVTVAEGWDPFPEAMRTACDVLRGHPAIADWWTYLFIHRDLELLIGTGGFHGGPDKRGMVEIGYGIAPRYTGRGFATQAAEGLVHFAFQHPEVRMVDARTLPEEGASTAILRKIGMKTIGHARDPEAGQVWLWRIERKNYKRGLLD
jgi:ribosomal-protein-alanine N-acetyltransferase